MAAALIHTQGRLSQQRESWNLPDEIMGERVCIRQEEQQLTLATFPPPPSPIMSPAGQSLTTRECKFPENTLLCTT